MDLLFGLWILNRHFGGILAIKQRSIKSFTFYIELSHVFPLILTILIILDNV